MKDTQAVQFVQENLKTLFSYSLSKVSSWEDAQDLTSEIVLGILQSADKMKNANAFYGYVWGIARNTYKKFYTRKRKNPEVALNSDLSSEEQVYSDLEEKEELNMLRREIAFLSQRYRECTVAYYFDQLSCNEIAKKYDLSLEMVKYYLFKTRKIIKEGISMEKEFGQRSFRPTPFQFVSIVSEKVNAEYHRLFARKLPGQILMAAYYVPMSASELAIELGVATVYLEDELALLESYNLLYKNKNGKYQTNILIFSDEFFREFYRTSKEMASETWGKVILGIREKISAVQAINQYAERMQENRLVWPLVWITMFYGHLNFAKRKRTQTESDCEGDYNVRYGIGTDKPGMLYAGYAAINDQYHGSGIDFSFFDQKNKMLNNYDPTAMEEELREAQKDHSEKQILIVNKKEEEQLLEVLSAEIERMEELYASLYHQACCLMKSHAPQNAISQIERVVKQALFFETIDLLSEVLEKTGLVEKPEFEGAAAFYIKEMTPENDFLPEKNKRMA